MEPLAGPPERLVEVPGAVVVTPEVHREGFGE